MRKFRSKASLAILTALCCALVSDPLTVQAKQIAAPAETRIKTGGSGVFGGMGSGDVYKAFPVQIKGTAADNIRLKASSEIFARHNIMNPGDTYEATILFENKGMKEFYFRLADIVNQLPKDTRLLDVLELEIWQDGELFYRGSYSDAKGSKIWSKIVSGQSVTFDVRILFPGSCGNEFQGLSYETSWIFEAQMEKPKDEPVKPDPNKPGDDPNKGEPDPDDSNKPNKPNKGDTKPDKSISKPVHDIEVDTGQTGDGLFKGILVGTLTLYAAAFFLFKKAKDDKEEKEAADNQRKDHTASLIKTDSNGDQRPLAQTAKRVPLTASITIDPDTGSETGEDGDTETDSSDDAVSASKGMGAEDMGVQVSFSSFGKRQPTVSVTARSGALGNRSGTEADQTVSTGMADACRTAVVAGEAEEAKDSIASDNTAADIQAVKADTTASARQINAFCLKGNGRLSDDATLTSDTIQTETGFEVVSGMSEGGSNDVFDSASGGLDKAMTSTESKAVTEDFANEKKEGAGHESID